jgi:hypothetical protein
MSSEAREAATAQAREAVTTAMTVAVNRFCFDMAELRHWAEEVTDSTWSSDNVGSSRHEKSPLAREDRRRAEHAVDRLWDKLNQAVEAVLGDQESDTDSAKGIGQRYPISPEQLIAWMILQVDRDHVNTAIVELNRECNDDPALIRHAVLYAQSRFRQQSGIAGKLFLPTIVSSWEELLAALVRQWLTLYPRALGVEKESLIVEDLARYPVEDLFRRAIDDRIVNFVDRPPEDWAADLRQFLHLDLQGLMPDWATFREAFARRNVYVHAGGRADQRYLQRLPAEYPRPDLGEPLLCDRAYFDRLIAVAEYGGVALSVAFLAHFTANGGQAAELAANHVPRALREGLWNEARVVATAALAGQPSDHEHHELRINLWMAHRELGMPQEELAREISAWSAPDELRYRLAISALLLDEAATLSAWRECEAAGENLAHLADWPLLLQMRKRFARLGSTIARTLGRQANAARIQRRDAGTGRTRA